MAPQYCKQLSTTSLYKRPPFSLAMEARLVTSPPATAVSRNQQIIYTLLHDSMGFMQIYVLGTDLKKYKPYEFWYIPFG